MSGGFSVLVAGASGGASLVGDLLLLANAASAAACTVLGRRAFAERDLLAVLSDCTAYGPIFLAPLAA